MAVVATQSKKPADNNYSAIEQNSRQIKDLFKKLQKRAVRVDRSLSHTRDIYFRNMKQLRNEHDLHNKNLREELDSIARHGIQLAAGSGAGKSKSMDGGKKKKAAKRKARKIDTGLEKLKRPITPKREMSIKMDEEFEKGSDDVKKNPWENSKRLQLQEEAFRVLYSKQKENVKKSLLKVETYPPNPVLDAMFSRDEQRQSEITHVDYLQVMGKAELRARILEKLNQMHKEEIQSYGEEKFEVLLGECNDRRIMFKLINGEITLDQFIVKVACEAGGIKYLCKDDLLQQGVSPEFFQEIDFRNDVTGVQRQFVERLKATEGDIVETPREQLGSDVGSVFKTEQYRRYQKITTSDKNKWRNDRRCVKSVFSIVPDEIHSRQKQRVENKFQTFSKLKRFSHEPEIEEGLLSQGAAQTLEPSPAKQARVNSDLGVGQGTQPGRDRLSVPDIDTMKSRYNNSISPKLSAKSSMIPAAASKAPRVTRRPAPAKKEGLEKHLRHSLLFIRRLLDERPEGTVLYNEATKINMMYQKELTQFLDQEKKEKLMQQGNSQKGHLETVHIVRGELKKRKKGVRQILQEAGIIKEKSNLNVNEFLKLKNLVDEDGNTKSSDDVLRKKLELMMIECQERYKREHLQKAQREPEAIDFLKIDAKRRPDALILDEQSDMQILQQVTLPNSHQQQKDSLKELMSIPSLFQPTNIYQTHDDSEKDIIELENNQENSSAGHTQLHHMGIDGTPEQVVSATLPVFHDPEAMIKETTLVNADLPIEVQEQSFGGQGLPTSAITPISENESPGQRPFAKTQRLIEMESNRSSRRHTQRQKQTTNAKFTFGTAQPPLSSQRRETPLIRVTSAAKRPPPPRDLVDIHLEQTRSKQSINQQQQFLASTRNGGQARIAQQICYPEQVLLHKVPIDLHASDVRNRAMSVQPMHHKGFGVRRKSAPANRNHLDMKNRQAMRTIDDHFSSNVSTQAPGGRTGRNLRARLNSVTTRRPAQTKLTSKTAAASGNVEHYNYEPGHDNREIQSLMQQLSFKAPPESAGEQFQIHQGIKRLRAEDPRAATADNATELRKRTHDQPHAVTLNRRQLESIGPGSGVFMDQLLPAATLDSHKQSSTPENSSIQNAQTQAHEQPENERFIKYIESLGIFVNRRSSTALSLKGTKDCLDSQAASNVPKNKKKRHHLGIQKQKDASVGHSGQSGRSLDKGSAGRNPEQLTAELISSTVDKDRHDNSFQIKRDSENQTMDNTRYQIIVMQSPGPQQYHGQVPDATSLMTLPMMSDTQNNRQSSAKQEQNQKFQYLNLALQDGNTHSGDEQLDMQQRAQPQPLSHQAEGFVLSKGSMLDSNQRNAPQDVGAQGQLLSSFKKVGQLSQQFQPDQYNFNSTIVKSNSSHIKAGEGTTKIVQQRIHKMTASPSPQALSGGLHSAHANKAAVVSHQDTATVFNSGSQDRNESVEKFHFKPQYVPSNSGQKNLHDVFMAQSTQQLLSEGAPNVMSQTMSVDGNQIIILSPSHVNQQNVQQVPLNRQPIPVKIHDANEGEQSDPNNMRGSSMNENERETNSTPMLMMNSQLAPKHQLSSLYEENIKMRSIMDTSPHRPVEFPRADAPGSITMKVNVFSMSKYSKDNQQRSLAQAEQVALQNQSRHDGKRHFNSKDGFLQRTQARGDKSKVGHLDLARQLEVTPSSGMVKKIIKINNRVSPKSQRNSRREYNEEPGIHSSDNQSTLKQDPMLSPPPELDRDDYPHSLMNSPKDKPLDYRTNKGVLSRVYREAYIARSRKMSNLKSLALVRKNRAADFKHFLKQTVQQLSTQQRRQSRGVGYESKPILSTKYELQEISKLQQQAFMGDDERIATAERARSQNPTMSNRSVNPHQDLMVTPQMPSGTTIASKKNIAVSQPSNAGQAVLANDIPHSKMKHRGLLASKAEQSASKRNSDLAEIQDQSKSRISGQTRGSVVQMNFSASGLRNCTSGKSRPVTESLDHAGIMRSASQDQLPIIDNNEDND